MIKVWTGQVWECVKDELWNTNYGDKAKISKVGNDAVHYNSSMMSAKEFNRCFKFIPQNDLEFAAVTLDKWPPRTAQIHVKGGEILGCLLHNPNAINECQWQNMRYHLGLDKKPRYDLTKCEWVKQCKT